MNILDENISVGQHQLLLSWRISIHQIGYDLAWKGVKDEGIIPLLHQLRRPTFFTFDADFYRRSLCRTDYCLVYLAARQKEAGSFIRRFLRHPEFNTQTKRMGSVILASYAGLIVWHIHAKKATALPWHK